MYLKVSEIFPGRVACIVILGRLSWSIRSAAIFCVPGQRVSSLITRANAKGFEAFVPLKRAARFATIHPCLTNVSSDFCLNRCARCVRTCGEW